VGRRISARAARKQAAPLSTATLVDSTLHWLRLDDTVRGMRALRAFGLAAGPRILARARAERLRGHTLYVRVATSAWSHELHMLRASILERMHTIPGGEEVEALRFEVGEIDELTDWSAAPTQAPEAPRAATVAPSLPAAVHEALAAVADPELRQRLGDLLARSAQRDATRRR
jgi:hypothetical protein